MRMAKLSLCEMLHSTRSWLVGILYTTTSECDHELHMESSEALLRHFKGPMSE